MNWRSWKQKANLALRSIALQGRLAITQAQLAQALGTRVDTTKSWESKQHNKADAKQTKLGQESIGLHGYSDLRWH